MSASVIAGLDIGSKTVKMAVARYNEHRDTLELLAVAEEPSVGVRRGAVVNPDELSRCISTLKERVEQMASAEIEEVVVSLGGSHVYVSSSRGIVAVSRADQHISQEDVDRVMQAAQALSLSQNYEVLDTMPRQFIVDGEEGLKEVVGMRGIRLEAEVMAVCAFAPYHRNLQNAVNGAGLDIVDVIPSAIATSHAVLTDDQKELGVVMIEMGAGTTSMAVYEEGDLLHMAAFPVGSKNITNDIAIALRTEPEIAEQIKREYGTCIPPKSKKMEKLVLEDGTEVSFSRKFLSQVIGARVEEIFQLVNDELKKLGKSGKLPSGVVLTGGGINLSDLEQFVKKDMKLTTKVGTIEGVDGLPPDPRFSCVAGLLIASVEPGSESSTGPSGSDILVKLKRIVRSFIP